MPFELGPLNPFSRPSTSPSTTRCRSPNGARRRGGFRAAAARETPSHDQPLWCAGLLMSTFLTVIVGVKPSVGQCLASFVILPCSFTLLPAAGEVGSTPWWKKTLAAASVKV